MIVEFDENQAFLAGSKGKIPVDGNDELILKLAMIYEGECEGKNRKQTAEKYGYTRQRYYQVREQFLKCGSKGLIKQKTGPKKDYVRTDEVVRKIIGYRYHDPTMSPEVITQKLKQAGYKISIRSVQRVITEYGLQKKTSINALKKKKPQPLKRIARKQK